MRFRLASTFIPPLVLLASPGAWAVPAGPAATGPSVFQSIPAEEGGGGCTLFGGPCTWNVGAPDDRVEVVFDPASGPWTKELTDPEEGLVVADDDPIGGALLTEAFPMNEFLVIGGSAAWTDWHEEILEPGWTWQTATATATRPDASMESVVATISGGFGPDAPGTVADFVFDAPLPPGTTLDIVKEFAYTGPDGVFSPGAGPGTGSEIFEGTIRLAEHPTIDGIPVPEPLTLGLLLLGLGQLATRRLSGP